MGEDRTVTSLFSLDPSDSVLCESSCYWGKSMLAAPGKLYVTQRRMLWQSSITSSRRQILFSDVRTLEAQGALLVDSGILVTYSDMGQVQSVLFTGFSKRDDVLAAMIRARSAATAARAKSLCAPASPPRKNKYEWDAAAPQSAQVHAVAVDEKNAEGERASKRALRLAIETREVAAGTAAEIERQGETLGRIAAGVEDVHHNMDLASRHIRGIESWMGAITNKFTSVKDTRQPLPKPRTSVSPQPPSTFGTTGSGSCAPPRAASAGTACVDESDRDLEELSAVLKDLREIAQREGQALEEQQGVIDHVTDRVDLANARVKAANTRIIKLT
eukprot:m51a1_g832 putative synaptosomal-associated protein 23 (331) ;mRNA; f:736385-737524